MINLLTHTARTALAAQRRIRFAAILIAVCAVALAILLALLVPVYTVASDQYATLARYTEIEKESRALTRQDDSLRTARIVSAQIDAATLAAPHGIVNAIENVVRTHALFAERVALTGFAYTTIDTAALLRVSGIAESALVLSDFADALKRSGHFGEVVLPVSDLADDAGTFSLTLTLLTP